MPKDVKDTMGIKEYIILLKQGKLPKIPNWFRRYAGAGCGSGIECTDYKIRDSVTTKLNIEKDNK
jgi:hypothetical protein